MGITKIFKDGIMDELDEKAKDLQRSYNALKESHPRTHEVLEYTGNLIYQPENQETKPGTVKGDELE
ncbi:MAG: hypothetical protein ABEJ83_00085 [Candidatus Nanohaloarchaea archaeon]